MEQEVLVEDPYSLYLHFNYLQQQLFKEIEEGETIDVFRRNLQRLFVDKLGTLIHEESTEVSFSDIKALSRNMLEYTAERIDKRLKKQKNPVSKAHCIDLLERIDSIFEKEK